MIVIQRSEIKVEDKVVDVVSAGTALTIQSVQGDWLEASNGGGGWIKGSFVKNPSARRARRRLKAR
ncbi:MAG: hypothetical protein JSS27_21330 [Planctomycetes bacterium]|nr:hypothetical protein [Planctomycetota bacterium]